MRVKKWALMGILCGTMVLLAGCGKAQKAYKQAVALAENGSYEKAAASFKEAIAENKDKAEYYIDYGMTLNHLGSYKMERRLPIMVFMNMIRQRNNVIKH